MRKRRTSANLTTQSTSDQRTSAGPDDNGTWRLIAAKAYELFEERGRVDGHDLDDWLEAEAIVVGRHV
ncbi:MAG: DUF2934 domain-containing protein [Nitrospiraceae bacterium]